MITTYTPAAQWHCCNCDELFVEPSFTLRRGQMLIDNGDFYSTKACPSCESENIETAFSYRLRLQEQEAKRS